MDEQKTSAVCENHNMSPITETVTQSRGRVHLLRLYRCSRCREETLDYQWREVETRVPKV